MNREELCAALQQVADGDRAALRRVYDATAAKLLGVCVRILADTQEAEDVLQDVFITIWHKAPEFDATRASPITWAATIARNRSIDRLRSRNRRNAAPLDDAFEIADEAPRADALAEMSQEARLLHAALADIEPRAAAAIRAAFFEGATYAELASRAGVPEGTMKSWIRRGMMALRAKLDS